mgnify:CR=1 FL=1
MNQAKNSTTEILARKVGNDVAKKAPRVSVVIPTFNSAGFIEDTLNSVLAQSYKDYEVVLVNDGSPDSEKLEQTLEPYFERITYISQKNNGAAAARNTSIRNSRGEYLAFLDGDDIWYPNYLEEQVKLIDMGDFDFVYSDALLFDKVTRDNEKFSDRAPSDEPVTTKSLLASTASVLTSGTVVRKQRVLECGLFDEELPKIGTEDFDLWFRLARNGAKITRNDQVLLKYRIHSESLSGGSLKIAERDVMVIELTEEKYGLTESEKKTAAERKATANAYLDIERGKWSLSEEKFSEALDYFRRANEHYKTLKLQVVISLISISPKFARWLFKTLRPNEFIQT